MKPLFIWYFHSNVAIIFLKSNKMRYHHNDECTIASRSKFEPTQASVSHDTYQSSLPGHRQTMKPLFIWYFHSNVAIICLKSNKMRYHRNEECITASRSKFEPTQATSSLENYHSALHVHWHTMFPQLIW